MLLQHYIPKINDKTLSGDDLKILESLEKNLLRVNRDIYYGSDEHSQDETIWGYKIVVNGKIKYFKYNTEFIEVTSLELSRINISLQKRYKITSQNLSIIIGYMDEKNPEKKIIFKVRDKTGQGNKGTHKKTGSICGNDGMKKEQIIDFFSKITDDYSYASTSKSTLPGKNLLCLEIELYLRYNDLIKKDDKRWFFNTEESIELKLNDK